MEHRFLKTIKNNFITGIAIALPVFLTFVILNWAFAQLNSWILNPLTRITQPLLDSPYLLYLLKGLILLFLFTVIVLLGVATKNILLKRFFRIGERFLFRVPIVSKLYTSFKEVSSLFFGYNKRLFKKVVLVEYPRKGLYTVGLVTSEHIDRAVIGKEIGDDVSSIFVPTTPNPTSGVFVFVPKKDLVETTLSVEEALKVIISGGAIASEGQWGSKKRKP